MGESILTSLLAPGTGALAYIGFIKLYKRSQLEGWPYYSKAVPWGISIILALIVSAYLFHVRIVGEFILIVPIAFAFALLLHEYRLQRIQS